MSDRIASNRYINTLYSGTFTGDELNTFYPAKLIKSKGVSVSSDISDDQLVPITKINQLTVKQFLLRTDIMISSSAPVLNSLIFAGSNQSNNDAHLSSIPANVIIFSDSKIDSNISGTINTYSNISNALDTYGLSKVYIAKPYMVDGNSDGYQYIEFTVAMEDYGEITLESTMTEEMCTTLSNINSKIFKTTATYPKYPIISNVYKYSYSSNYQSYITSSDLYGEYLSCDSTSSEISQGSSYIFDSDIDDYGYTHGGSNNGKYTKDITFTGDNLPKISEDIYNLGYSYVAILRVNVYYDNTVLPSNLNGYNDYGINLEIFENGISKESSGINLKSNSSGSINFPYTGFGGNSLIKYSSYPIHTELTNDDFEIVDETKENSDYKLKNDLGYSMELTLDNTYNTDINNSFIINYKLSIGINNTNINDPTILMEKYLTLSKDSTYNCGRWDTVSS